MAAIKPLVFPEWDTTNTNAVEPDIDRKAAGWLFDGGVPEKPPVEYDNFVKKNLSDWINAINESGILLHDLETTYPNKALTMGSDGIVYRSQQVTNKNHEPVGDDGTWWKKAFLELGNDDQILEVVETQTSGTAGGGFTSGSFLQRVLNTIVVNTISGASLSANRVTLPAGKYEVEGDAPAFQVFAHAARLYNVTDAVEQGGTRGTSEASNADAVTRSLLRGVFTITTTKDFEVQHYANTTKATDGYGVATSIVGHDEVYSRLRFRKIEA